MFLLLLLGLVSSSALINKLIAPGDTQAFLESVGPNDQQLVIHLTNLTKEPGLRFKIIAPEHHSDSDEESRFEEDSNDEIGTELAEDIRNTYKVPGQYRVEIHNSSSKVNEIGIAMYKYSKVHESNKDLVELRNLLSSIQDAMDTLANKNYYLRTIQEKNVATAKFSSLMMNLLILSPILTAGIRYFKYLLSRQLVKPKGKRFRDMF